MNDALREEAYWPPYVYGVDDADPETAPGNFLAALTREIKFDPTLFEPQRGYYDKYFIGRTTKDRVIVACSRNELGVATRDRQYWYTASLEQNDGLTLSVGLVRELGHGSQTKLVKHPLMPSFTQLFELSLKYFQSLGIEIKNVNGLWSPEHGGLVNDNYKVFTSLVDQGMPPLEAARLTPTGKVVGKFGFVHVSPLKYKYHPIPEPGEEPGYGFVFSKQPLVG